MEMCHFVPDVRVSKLSHMYHLMQKYHIYNLLWYLGCNQSVEKAPQRQSEFTKEKKEEEVAPPEGENEGTGEKVEVEEEVKSGEDERKEDTKAEALRDDTGMGPPAEAPPG